MTFAPYKHQLDLTDAIARAPRFDGADIDDERDTPRLTGQLARILAYVRDGRWHTLAAISAATGAPEASVSAQLRNARKARFGGHTIKRQHIGVGLYEYRWVAP